MNSIDYAKNLTLEFTPPSLQLPGFIWSSLVSLDKIHRLWRWYRRFEVYKNPDNSSPLLLGHAMHFVMGESLLLKIAAQTVLIASRILKCIKTQSSVCREAVVWFYSLKGVYEPSYSKKWKKSSPFTWISPSTLQSWDIFARVVVKRTQRIGLCSLRITRKIGRLSMEIMDAADAISLNPETKNDAIREVFVNTLNCLQTLTENKETLLDGLRKNKNLIARILENTPFQYDQLVKTVESSFDKTEFVYEKAKDVSQFGNGILVDMGKKSLNSLMVLIGFSEYRPSALSF